MKQNIFKRIDWVSTLFLTLTPILIVPMSIYYFKTEVFNPWMIAVFFFFYYAMGLSITGGYHRLFAHKAYEAPFITRFLYLFFGAGAYQNSARKWVLDHRLHHRYVDHEDDPYSINKGFWFAHFFWMCLKEEWRDSNLAKPYTRDLDKDILIVLQDRYYYTIATFSCFILPMIVGWTMGSWLGGLLFGGLLRMVVVHHFTFFINSACHFWGKQPYTDENTARDNGFLAIFTYGEGYHNFHHIFHADYRNGIRWYHYDPTKWFIRFMSFIKMARALKVTPDYEIFKAKMLMMEKRFRAHQSYHWSSVEGVVESMKQKADDAHARFTGLCAEYETMKKNFTQRKDDRMLQLKLDIENAKKDLKVICNQWQTSLTV